MTLSLAGRRALSAHISLPYEGVWVADVELDTSELPSGRVELVVDTLTLSGTVIPSRTGSYQQSGRVRVQGGAAGWGATVRARHAHNDAGLQAGALGRELAGLVGEVLQVDAAADRRVGVDWTRVGGLASADLRRLFLDATWWVDAGGTTHVGTRPTVEVEAVHQVLDHDPRHRTAVVATERPDALVPGAVLRQGLDEPLFVRDVAIVAGADGVRILVWGARDDTDRAGNRLVSAFARTVRAVLPELALAFPRRYRVVTMQAERVALQAVRPTAGLPDVLPVSVWPGMAGHAADLTPGAIVLVDFVDGDPALPVVRGHSPEESPGWKPGEVRIDANTFVKMGDAIGLLARYGDQVAVGNAAGVLTLVSPLLGKPPRVMG